MKVLFNIALKPQRMAGEKNYLVRSKSTNGLVILIMPLGSNYAYEVPIALPTAEKCWKMTESFTVSTEDR